MVDLRRWAALETGCAGAGGIAGSGLEELRGVLACGVLSACRDALSDIRDGVRISPSPDCFHTSRSSDTRMPPAPDDDPRLLPRRRAVPGFGRELFALSGTTDSGDVLGNASKTGRKPE
jgi:hypothetical protein